MTAIAPSALDGRTYTVRSNWLFSLYSIIPVCFIFVLADQILFDAKFRDEYLPNDPATLLFWSIVFNFPHIVSSLVTLADKEYLQYYRTKFIKGISLFFGLTFLALSIVPLLFPYSVTYYVHVGFFLFIGIYTMWHVLSQQFGIGMMLLKIAPEKRYQRWRVLSTIAASFMYYLVFARTETLNTQIAGFSLQDILKSTSGAFVAIAVLQGGLIIRTAKKSLGKWFCIGNLAILPACYIMLLLGYEMLVIVIPRFIHDITAFMIYSVHDQNRNREKKHNYIYRWLSFIPIQPIILCPLLAIVLANSIECGSNWLDLLSGFNFKLEEKCQIESIHAVESQNGLPSSMRISLHIMYICGLFHYYIEGFVWKRDSIHRHSVRFG